MKLKNNPLLIIFAIIMTTSLIVGLADYYSYKKQTDEWIIEQKEKCDNAQVDYDPEKWQNFCEEIKAGSADITFFEASGYIRGNMPLPLTSFITLLMIVACCCYYPCRVFKNSCLNNYLTRMNYEKFKRKILFHNRLPIIIIPIAMIIVYIIAFITTGNLSYSISTLGWNKETISNLPLFFGVQFSMAIICSLIYANITMIICKKNHNFIAASLISYLTIIGIELFLEIVIGAILWEHILHQGVGVFFNIVEFVNFNDGDGLFSPLLVASVIFIITEIILYKTYKDKESLIINCEKND